MALTSEKALKSKFNEPNVQYCKYCGKECKNLNSLKQHECRCKENPNRKNYDCFSNYIKENRKGKTQYNCEEIAKQVSTMKEKYANGYQSPLKGRCGTWVGKHHTEESKVKIGKSVSKSRIEGYANGTITPAKGVGKGKYSYINYKNKKYMLRSTYEFIYALYLINKNIDFEFESIRVTAIRENDYAKTFISDFFLPQSNTIVEIKGIPSGKDTLIKESFESKGYNFKEYFSKDIEKFKEELREFYDIDDILNKIKEGHDSKNYFVYTV